MAPGSLVCPLVEEDAKPDKGLSAPEEANRLKSPGDDDDGQSDSSQSESSAGTDEFDSNDKQISSDKSDTPAQEDASDSNDSVGPDNSSSNLDLPDTNEPAFANNEDSESSDLLTADGISRNHAPFSCITSSPSLLPILLHL